MYLDERRRGAKREALEWLATSKEGPLAVYMNSMTEPPEVRTASIAFRFADKRSVFGAGRTVRVEFEPMRNPITGKEHLVTGVLPTGLFTKSEDFYSTKAFEVEAEPLSYRYPGRNAIASRSVWRGH